jgi:aminoglycoside phosphotransferase (APT) family kinase protein
MNDRTVLTTEQLARVRAMLVAAGETVVGSLTADLITGGRSNLTFRVQDRSSAWVLRRPPLAGLTPSAHDVGREFRICSALVDSPVPVARPVFHDVDGTILGTEMVVFEFVEGQVVRSRDDVASWGRADFDCCARAMMTTLADLHSLDVDGAGLGDLASRDGHAQRQLSRWRRQWSAMGVDRRAAEDLARVLEWRIPKQSGVSLVHGDYRIDNLLLATDDVGAVEAVVDWELATLGEPASDIALMCAYRHPGLDVVLGFPAAWTSPLFPATDDLLVMYESATGSRVNDWGFHIGLAYYKLAGIAEGIAHRFRLGAGDHVDLAEFDDVINEFLAAGIAAGRRA